MNPESDSRVHQFSPPKVSAPELTAEQIFATFRRELRPVDVPDVGCVYVYEPMSVAEFDAYQKHVHFKETGITISAFGIVSSIIARVRDKSGRPLFSPADEKRLLDMPAASLMAIWNSISADRVAQE